MKNILPLLAGLLALALLIPSCGESAPEVSEYADPEGIFEPFPSAKKSTELFGGDKAVNGIMTSTRVFDGEYAYFVGNLDGGVRTLLRQSLVSGTILPVCGDPVCTHLSGSGCPFTEVDSVFSFQVRNGLIYYCRTKETDKKSQTCFYSYDPKTLEEKELGNVTKGGRNWFFDPDGNPVFETHPMDEDGEEHNCVDRLNVKKGSLERIFDFTPSENMPMIPKFTGVDTAGRYWFEEGKYTDAGILLSAYYITPNEPNRHVVKEALTNLMTLSFVVCGDELLYFLPAEKTVMYENGEEMAFQTLCSKNVKTGKEAVLAEGCTNIWVLGNTVYYRCYPASILQGKIPESGLHRLEPCLYRFNLQSGEKTTYPLADPNLVIDWDIVVFHRGRLYGENGELYENGKSVRKGVKYVIDLRTGKWREGTY